MFQFQTVLHVDRMSVNVIRGSLNSLANIVDVENAITAGRDVNVDNTRAI